MQLENNVTLSGIGAATADEGGGAGGIGGNGIPGGNLLKMSGLMGTMGMADGIGGGTTFESRPPGSLISGSSGILIP